MLFDLRSRGRRRTVQAIYVGLAILIGGGLVLSGIGSNASGGLLDALVGRGGSESGAAKLEREAQKATRARPADPAAWGSLVRARYQRAVEGDNYNQQTGAFSLQGKRKLAEAADAWERYLGLTRAPDPGLAALAVRAYGEQGLRRFDRAAAAQEIITAAQPNPGGYAQLAVLAYQAGQTRKGDLAAARAVQLAPKEQRATLRAQLDQAKAQLRAGASGAPASQPAPSG